MHELQGELCLLGRIIRVVAGPVLLKGTLGKAKTRAVIGDDCPELRKCGGDTVPRERTGPEPMQEQEEWLALPIDLVMKTCAADEDEPAVLIREFARRSALIGVHGNKKRSECQQDEQSCEDKSERASQASHYGCAATCARKSAVAWTTSRHCSSAVMVAEWSPICVP